MFRHFVVVAVAATALGVGAAAAQQQQPVENPNAGGGPSCVLSGSESVRVQGTGMLRLGDVAGCPDVRYEVIPGVFINGQPAVRLLPDEDCAPRGSESVTIGGAPAGRAGDC